MNLTPRLQTIIKHIPQNSICGDIGTDHGYIPIHLIQNNISPKVIATDVNKGPIEIAKKQVKLAGLEHQIETRLGDGLQPLMPGEIDTVVIAGMGGLLIKDILEASKEVVDSIQTFILQPMIAQRDLRKYLLENNFTIIEEDLAQEDQRVYEIIIATHGKQEVEKEIYLDIPKPLIDNKHSLLKALINRKKNGLLKIMKACEGKNTPNSEKRIQECKTKLEEIEEVEQCL